MSPHGITRRWNCWRVVVGGCWLLLLYMRSVAKRLLHQISPCYCFGCYWPEGETAHRQNKSCALSQKATCCKRCQFYFEDEFILYLIFVALFFSWRQVGVFHTNCRGQWQPVATLKRLLGQNLLATNLTYWQQTTSHNHSPTGWGDTHFFLAAAYHQGTDWSLGQCGWGYQRLPGSCQLVAKYLTGALAIETKTFFCSRL